MIQQGKCPKCGGELEYGDEESADMTLWYECWCSKKCGFIGAEHYNLSFAGFTDARDPTGKMIAP